MRGSSTPESEPSLKHITPCIQGKQQPDQRQAGGAEPGIGASVSSPTSATPVAEEFEACSDDSHPHLLPKVQVPFSTKSGETPRRVQIQR